MHSWLYDFLPRRHPLRVEIFKYQSGTIRAPRPPDYARGLTTSLLSRTMVAS